MYTIIDKLNDNLLIGLKNNITYALKKINMDDVDIMKQLMTLNNRHVVKIFELVTIDENLYCVQEYIDGVTLDEYLKQNGALPEYRAVPLINEICCGLRDIHNLGIVHRDINPSNIMIDRYGSAVIIDFGISRTNKEGKKQDTQILGTHGYAAPEQYGFSQTDARSDIYSLGVLINYMTTLSMPNEQKPPGRLGEVVSKCTQIDEKNRYSSIDEVMNEINGTKTGAQRSKFALPGFRSNVRWHKIAASIYYCVTVFMLIVWIAPVGDTSHNLFFFVFTIFMMIVSVPIFTNYLGWADRFSNNSPKMAKRISVLSGLIYLFVTLIVFIIIDSV